MGNKRKGCDSTVYNAPFPSTIKSVMLEISEISYFEGTSNFFKDQRRPTPRIFPKLFDFLVQVTKWNGS